MLHIISGSMSAAAIDTAAAAAAIAAAAAAAVVVAMWAVVEREKLPPKAHTILSARPMFPSHFVLSPVRSFTVA